MSRENWCKHYNGTANSDTCRADVKYELVVIGKGTKDCSYPCFKDRNPLDATCEKREFETPEETAARKADQAKRFERFGKIRAAIVKFLGGPWKKARCVRHNSMPMLRHGDRWIQPRRIQRPHPCAMLD